MKKLFFLSIFAFLSVHSCVAQEKYNRAKIYTNGPAGGIQELLGFGLPADHGEVKNGIYIISDFSETELAIARSNGFQVEILIDDVAHYYVNQETNGITLEGSGYCNPKGKEYLIPQNFSLGSMGGYFTYQEMLDILDQMAVKYPNLISQKQSIGTSTEGRHLYMVKISDNPNLDENEPEVFYNSLHHAREPASLSQLIYYMWYLLEQYATNDEVKNLVNNLELYFVPCVNPDGYVFNHTNYPNGGGMWRKNRRNNGDGSFGVDLNRNYGHAWGYDNSGSSPSTSSDVYRGPAAFSEPETQAIRDFCNNREFKLALNNHTYGNLLIYPWGYLPSYFTPDSALFVNFGIQLTAENRFTHGTGDQTVGYLVNGDSDDWMYGEQTSKPKIYAMTPEAGEGSDGFWPASAKIVDICKSNIYQNLKLAHLALKHATIEDKTPDLLSKNTTHIPFAITCIGLDVPASFNVSIIPLLNITAVPQTKNFNGMTALEQRMDSFAINFTAGLKLGDEIKYVLSVNNGAYTSYDTITKIYDNGTIAFADNGSNMSNWQSATWNKTSSTYVSAPSSITDSPFGKYTNNANTYITLTEAVDLTDASVAYLTFHAKWDIEANYDYVQILGSTDGSSWLPLCGKHTKESSITTIFGQPVYDGKQMDWVEETINLKDFLGKKVKFRFRLRSDQYTTADGFYFDDLKVSALFSTTGINNKDDEKVFISAQPNPARDYVYISHNIPKWIKDPLLQLMDMNGRLIKTQAINPEHNNSTLNTSDLQPGIYFYTIKAEGIQVPVKKLAVIR